MTAIRALVFGATGTGKTSLCNLLTDRTRPTDNGPLGVTSKSHSHAPFDFEGLKIELVDTVGLHESSFGTVPADKAIVQLVELLTTAKEGFSLLIHVVRATRITKEQEEDYDFFVNKMTERKVPVILVLTGCENEDPMSAWVDKNRGSFSRFLYKALVPTCLAKGGALESHFAPLRIQSKDAILNAIKNHALPEPHRFYGEGTNTTFNEALTRVWNQFVDWAKLPDKYRAQVNESAYALLKRLGVSEAAAQMALKHLPDLLGELASKAPFPGAGPLVRAAVRRVLEKLVKKPD